MIISLSHLNLALCIPSFAHSTPANSLYFPPKHRPSHGTKQNQAQALRDALQSVRLKTCDCIAMEYVVILLSTPNESKVALVGVYYPF